VDPVGPKRKRWNERAGRHARAQCEGRGASTLGYGGRMGVSSAAVIGRRAGTRC